MKRKGKCFWVFLCTSVRFISIDKMENKRNTDTDYQFRRINSPPPNWTMQCPQGRKWISRKLSTRNWLSIKNIFGFLININIHVIRPKLHFDTDNLTSPSGQKGSGQRSTPKLDKASGWKIEEMGQYVTRRATPKLRWAQGIMFGLKMGQDLKVVWV